MRRLAFLLFLFAAQAEASDFRILDFGQSCANVAELEGAIGSRPMQWDPQRQDLQAFKARVFDRDVSVLYFCPNDALFGGHYFLPDEGLPDALKTFRALYDSLTFSYGDAMQDNTPWQRTADARFTEADPRKYMVTWHDTRVKTTLSLMPTKKDESGLWHVFVIVVRDKR